MQDMLKYVASTGAVGFHGGFYQAHTPLVNL